jgi:hypothetical protein
MNGFTIIYLVISKQIQHFIKQYIIESQSLRMLEMSEKFGSMFFGMYFWYISSFIDNQYIEMITLQFL